MTWAEAGVLSGAYNCKLPAARLVFRGLTFQLVKDIMLTKAHQKKAVTRP